VRTIGIIGGMAWESSAVYYRVINEEVSHRLGGSHSARIVLNSANFADFIGWHRADDWSAVEAEIIEMSQALERAGADCVVIACNTQHAVADAAAAKIGIPLLHIADATGAAIQAAGLRRVALLGTRFTMDRDFFTGRLADRFGIQTILPAEADRDVLHRTIFDEFAAGVYTEDTRGWYIGLVNQLVEQGAEGVVLGCTEISLLLRPADMPGVRLFDTTRLHAMAAVEFSFAGS
jgi:aspartate racemase